MGRAPTGEQWVIGVDDDELVVTEVGGTLRSWRRGEVDLLAGFGRDEECLAGRGQQLIPWPNRIRDGRYTFGGVERQLPLSEPRLHNASHGLVRWALWRLVERDGSSLTVGYRLHPQPGWSWHLDLTTRYAVAPDGLTVTTAVTNVGDEAAPFGCAHHPYLATGAAGVDDIVLTVPAATWVDVDDRLLPVGKRDVAGTAYDFRQGAPVGRGRRVDTAYTDLAADPDGRWRVRVEASGRGPVELWGEAAALPWVQVFTGKVEDDAVGVRGVAVEPMTCGADAFNSGDSLITLEPGATWRGVWGIAPH